MSPRPLSRCLSLLLLLLPCVTSRPAAAISHFADVIATSGWTHAGGPTTTDQYPRSAVPGDAATASLIDVGTPTNGARGFSTATAASGVGFARAKATASAEAASPIAGSISGQSGSGAYADFDDLFVVNAAGIGAGTQALLTFSIELDGAAGGSGTLTGGGTWGGNAFWRGTAVVGSDVLSESQSIAYETSGFVQTGTGRFGSHVRTVTITLGAGVAIMLRAEANASVGVSTAGIPAVVSASVASDLGSTLRWGGIRELRLSDGSLVSDFTALSSTSGMDYRNAAVPEPGSFALVALGLAGLAAGRRR